MPIAVGAGELSVVLLLLVTVVLPVAAIAFARSGKGLEELGKGQWSVDREQPRSGGGSAPPDPSEREAEVRQMVEASAFRRSRRGEDELNVESEIERVLGLDPEDAEGAGPGDTAGDSPPVEQGLREEVRQLVVANNERRIRRGEEPLDVESEIDRYLAEWS